ncbi:hypothetical protein [Dethiothermospora halolimnae]|uniref:hypothetical protein n=1 Tax=Dethiothermospora halolimnae TaxID=3114390 RepID=UPI003CCB87E4
MFVSSEENIDFTIKEVVFYDIGALVFFVKIIEWEFPGFSVDRCFDRLVELQQRIEKDGYVETTEHRYYMILKKI